VDIKISIDIDELLGFLEKVEQGQKHPKINSQHWDKTNPRLYKIPHMEILTLDEKTCCDICMEASDDYLIKLISVNDNILTICYNCSMLINEQGYNIKNCREKK